MEVQEADFWEMLAREGPESAKRPARESAFPLLQARSICQLWCWPPVSKSSAVGLEETSTDTLTRWSCS